MESIINNEMSIIESSLIKTEKPFPESLHSRFKMKLFAGRMIKYNIDHLEVLLKLFPDEILKEIAEYDYDDRVQNAYDKVMNKLKLSLKERKNLNFYSGNDFLERLELTVVSHSDKFPKFDLFWADLTRLIFKNIVYLKQEGMIEATDKELLKTRNLISSIIFIISEKSHSDISINFNPRTMNIHDFSSDLLNSEFFEHAEFLAHCFANALEYFYSPLFDSEKQKKNGMEMEKMIDEITCEEFKMKFFDNGNPNKNILLKYFMIRFDYRGRLIRACLESNTQPNYSKISKEIIKEIKNDIKELRLKGIEHFIKDIPSMVFGNDPIMKFI